MPTNKSVAEVEELKAVLAEAKLIISTDYRGLTVTELSALRRAIRESGGTYRVAKNTLVKIASNEIDRPEIAEIVVGPTGFVMSTDDPVAPARALMNHIDENRLEVVINGAYLEGRVLDADRVRHLSSLPGRDELIAKLLGQMNAPIANLAGVLSGTLRGLLTVIQAHIDQGGNLGVVEEEAPTAEAPAEEESADAPEAATEEPVAEAEAEATEESADAPEAATEEPVAEAEAEATEESADAPEAAAEEPVAEAEAEATEESADAPEAAAEEPVAEAEAEESAEEAEEPAAEETGEAEEEKSAK
jgi:large subunit ribosomal protein L10